MLFWKIVKMQRGSYNPVRLIMLPSSSGIGPENWLASTPLKNSLQ